jgi:hypothetical protein
VSDAVRHKLVNFVDVVWNKYYYKFFEAGMLVGMLDRTKKEWKKGRAVTRLLYDAWLFVHYCKTCNFSTEEFIEEVLGMDGKEDPVWWEARRICKLEGVTSEKERMKRYIQDNHLDKWINRYKKWLPRRTQQYCVKEKDSEWVGKEIVSPVDRRLGRTIFVYEE